MQEIWIDFYRDTPMLASGIKGMRVFSSGLDQLNLVSFSCGGAWMSRLLAAGCAAVVCSF